jgi:hypothetical protein
LVVIHTPRKKRITSGIAASSSSFSMDNCYYDVELVRVHSRGVDKLLCLVFSGEPLAMFGPSLAPDDGVTLVIIRHVISLHDVRGLGRQLALPPVRL